MGHVEHVVIEWEALPPGVWQSPVAVKNALYFCACGKGPMNRDVAKKHLQRKLNLTRNGARKRLAVARKMLILSGKILNPGKGGT